MDILSVFIHLRKKDLSMLGRYDKLFAIAEQEIAKISDIIANTKDVMSDQ